MSKLRPLRLRRCSYNSRMSLEQIRKYNDLLRTQFKGGQVLMTEGVRALPQQLRGQALYLMGQYNAFDQDSDHSEGLFFCQSFAFHFHIGEFAGGLAITLSTYEESGHAA